MRFVYLCFVIVFISQADTDILTSVDGPVVGWIDSGNNAFLMKPAPAPVPVPIGQGNSMNLSFCDGYDTDPIILVAMGSDFVEDATVKSISTSDLTVIIDEEIGAMDFNPPIQCSIIAPPELPRYIRSQEDRIALIDLYTGYTDIQDHRFLAICSLDPWSSNITKTADTTNWIESQSQYCQYTSLLTGGTYVPFALQSGGSYPPMGPSQYRLSTVYLNGDTLVTENIYSVYGDPGMDPAPTALASGICSSGQIGLWYDENGFLWSADFVGSPESPDLSEVTLVHDDLPFPAALTASMDDDGILLAWCSGSEIIVRHWLGGWSSYSHIVESCGSVLEDNISVCSDIDGYWVTWLEDEKSIPEVRFIPRETVTEIHGEQSASVENDFLLSISPNPILDQAVVSFAISEISEYHLNLFDVAGRTVLEIASGLGREFSGTFSLKNLPSGVYVLKLQTPQLERSLLLVNTVK